MKLIDQNLLPYSCKKLKKNNEKIKIEKEEEENDKVYKRQIQKINDNFQLNRGGFIQMNDYNFNLHKQRNYFRQMLKKNKENNNQINNILKNLTKEEKIHLKYSKFKMNNILSTPKKDINVNEFILSNKNKELKRPESCAFLHIDPKFNLNTLKNQKLKLNEIADIYDKNLSKKNLLRINKKSLDLDLIKNKSLKKKIYSWNDFNTEGKYINLNLKKDTEQSMYKFFICIF